MDLAAHRESYYNGHVLHRDISAGNIVIYNGGGLLIDWDMSKDLDLTSDDKTISRIVGYISCILDSYAYHLFRYFQGTWAFQSLRLSRRPKNIQAQLVHGRVDDLESFYHVLFWVSLQHARHALNSVELYDVLTRLFDHALIDGGKAYSNLSKVVHMKSNMMLEEVDFQNLPLLELLFKLSAAFQVLYVSPPKSINIQNPPVKKSKESYQSEPENLTEGLKFLKSDDDSNWMEVYFENALQFTDDEWGPTGYISNEITSSFATANNTKRKYTDMMTSNIRYNQGGTFYQSSKEDEGQDIIMNESEDDEDYDDNGGESVEKNDQPSSSRRRLN